VSSPERRSDRTATLRDAIGLGVAVGLYGAAFGAAADAAGLNVWQAMSLSALMFTGASQFAFIGVAAAGGAPLSGAATALMLGTRNTLYGLKLAPMLRFAGWRRVGAAQLVIDESTAMSVTRETHEAARVGFLSTGLAVFVFWNLFTFLGAIAGNLIGDPRTYGLDAAVGGAFLALLWPRLADPRNRVIAVAAAAVALGVVPLTAAGVPVPVAGGVALLAGILTRNATDATEIPS
jgi:predicted branched-subunit amino acid permease